ncbi:S-adenosyl-L-methionine-dependent methyltransferase [Amniculicola lignicola CBS 123094]|uniref:S-adenosyl-L-methionine-dependent methyltransferase n=1 Tax=Amniculicola lignicola CBS 123094 TaxID=1392246 RepID=A0A6A5W1V7_9PLEO|nr:S-adenosyl-L-methionine-dependent methyltransferase [Amniculicola lignicola CBS 123094]
MEDEAEEIYICAKNRLSVEEIFSVEKTGADPVVLGRLIRHQALIGIIKETNKNEFLVSKTTKNLSVPEMQAGLYSCPTFQGLPGFLAEWKYKSPKGLANTSFNTAWKTEKPIWQWIHESPKYTTYFNRFMYSQRSNTKNCFSLLPITEECKDWPSTSSVFVDIGGGTGQKCATTKETFPNLKGKIILQDLPAVTAEAKLSQDIDVIPYDFFTPQPIKESVYSIDPLLPRDYVHRNPGPKNYYPRASMHDHSDDECLKILQNIVDAMAKDSTPASG